MARKLSSPLQIQQIEYQFQLGVDIKRTNQRPLFQSTGKIIYEVRWINKQDPPIVLLQINGPTANQEALFYTRFNNHSNIIKTYGRVRNNSDLVMLLQERSPKPDLSEMLRVDNFQPKERVLCRIFEQICDAMIVLSQNNVVHGDLACRNILVFQSDPTEPNKNLVKLTDFGLTRDLRADNSANASTIFIPVRYAAPEILRNSNRVKYSQESDIYSMGVLMWEACSYGEIPYSSIEKDPDVQQRKLNDERLPQPPLCSDQLWIIINECLNFYPSHRPTFHTLKERLSNLDSQAFLKSHQQPIMNRKLLSNRKARLIPCQFCPEVFPSTRTLHDHLILCGNKTEQCLACHQFIRRAIFNYHTDNNCANLDETDTSSSSTSIRLAHVSDKNFNRERFEMNTVNVQNQGSRIHQNISNYSIKSNDRTPTPISNSRILSTAVERKYRLNTAVQNDCRIHKDNCLQNPTYVNHMTQRLQPLKLNQNQARSLIEESSISCTPMYIPCEICKTIIEKSEYLVHTEDCLKQYKHRNEKRAQWMSRPPPTERIPCEFCKKLYLTDQLSLHQISCPQSPYNTIPIEEPIRRRYPLLPAIITISTPKPDENPSTSSLSSSPVSQSSMFNPIRTAHLIYPTDESKNDRKRPTAVHNVNSNNYTKTDIDRKHLLNGLRNNDRLNRTVIANQLPEQQATINTPSFELRNISRNNFIDESITEVLQRHRLFDRQRTVSRSNCNQQEEFRTITQRSKLFSNSFHNSTYSPNAALYTGEDPNVVDENYFNHSESNISNNYNEFQTKNQHPRSRRRRSKRIKARREPT